MSNRKNELVWLRDNPLTANGQMMVIDDLRTITTVDQDGQIETDYIYPDTRYI